MKSDPFDHHYYNGWNEKDGGSVTDLLAKGSARKSVQNAEILIKHLRYSIVTSASSSTSIGATPICMLITPCGYVAH